MKNYPAIALCIISTALSLQAQSKESWDSAACKGTIALEFMKDASIIKSEMTEPNVYTLSYIREADGKMWRFKCKMDGTNTVWVPLYDDGSLGRWRDNSSDMRYTASSNGAAASIVRVCTVESKPTCIEVNRDTGSQVIEQTPQSTTATIGAKEYAAACRAVISSEFGTQPDKLTTEEQVFSDVHRVSDGKKIAYFCDAEVDGLISWKKESSNEDWTISSWQIDSASSTEVKVCKQSKCATAKIQ